jgi:hypothetical protein
MAKNLCAKTVKRDDAYEVWRSRDGSWTWYVLKKWQADDAKPYARWFCDVVSPFCPDGEMGDVYVSDIKSHAVKVTDRIVPGVKDNLTAPVPASS